MDQNGGETTQAEGFGRCLSSYADDENAHDIHRYYLSRRSALEMLKDRGYSVPASEIDLSLPEFKALHGLNPDIDRLQFSATHASDPNKRMLIMFSGPGVIKVGTVRLIAGQIANKDTLTGLVLILENQITNQALKAMDLFKFKVEMFQITDLLINITKHVLKPKHQVLTDEEKKKILKDYCIEEKQLPRILRRDAIARYYGLEKGQVVKVTYSGDITESHVTYRCVW
ncbi:DNA-directed RNA polymerase V subunit 5A [Mercurialis annua]|uniref:DNA-directed RNA polymerase V subunit 5A n=1 Tax=Mercurialis annua TaxID=3986 RepID=UPI00215F1A4D|nr:DNA-directed RNA polymerase V subunit 5A [Mercurialis annua]